MGIKSESYIPFPDFGFFCSNHFSLPAQPQDIPSSPEPQNYLSDNNEQKQTKLQTI